MSRKKLLKNEGGRGKVAASCSVARGDAGRGKFYIRLSLFIFTGTLAGILLTYSLRDGGFRLNYSISRYVGREAWSAIVFLISNLVVGWCWLKYIQARREELGEVWAIFGMMTVVMLVALSLCPIGLFDAEWGSYGAVSIIHQIASRWMFGAMAMMVAVRNFWQLRGVGGRRGADEGAGGTRLTLRQHLAVGFLAYAGLCVILSLTTQIFWDVTFMFETAYIYFFIVMLML